MADIQTQLPVKLTDNTNTAAITAGSALKVDGSAVTQPVSGTVTLSSQTVTFAAGSTVTAVQSGTYTVSVSNAPTVTTNADASVGAGTAPSKALLGALVYNTSAPSPTNGQTVALQGDSSGNLKVVLQGDSTVTLASGSTVTLASGTTVTSVQSGTYTVSVSNSPTVTIGATSVTQPVSGTVTLASGTTVTAVQSGTYNVAFGEVTTGIVNSYATVTSVAHSSTGTISYTVTTGKTLYVKGIQASSSGGPCKVVVDYSGGTVAGVGFYSAAFPFLKMVFEQPFAVPATDVINVKITNSAGAAQDVYATIQGHEIP